MLSFKEFCGGTKPLVWTCGGVPNAPQNMLVNV